MKHLTDPDIQNYLDSKNPVNRAEVEQHLKQCPECFEQFQAYQHVFRKLGEDIYLLPATFADSVMEEIRHSEKSTPEWHETAAMVALFIAGVIATLYMLNLDPLLSLEPGMIRQFARPFRWFFSGEGLLVLMAGTVIAIYGLLDKLIFRMHW